ncbi:MAG: hypothetical protein ACNI3A_11665 [Desulfovibrio sp.]|uniref:hypothetical protein n=1 Tax=Desulfovibrio sp. 7SRBS1 TaxID=3378064 RepID=UPI003B3FD801
MQKRLALVGPSDSMEIMRESMKRFFPDVPFNTYVRERTEDVHEVLEQSQSECDGLLFSGVGVQAAAKAGGVLTKPYTQIERGAYSLIRAFSEIQRRGLSFDRISVDVVTQQVISEVIREFGIPFGQVYSMPFTTEHTEREFLEWHRELLETNKVDLAICGFGSVYQELVGLGYPVFRMLPSSLQVRDTVEHLLGAIAARGLRSAGIAIQIVRLFRKEANPVNQYDRMKDEGRFFLELLEYVRAIQGSIFTLGKHEYVIFATRGVIESPVHLDLFGSLIAWGRRNNINVCSGIGIGVTAFEAEKAAQTAIAHSLERDHGGMFLVHDDQIRGPLGEEDELRYRTRIGDDTLLRIANEVGVTPTYVDRIRAIMDKTGKNTFDSAELAACLGIGERSARRVLKKFLDSGHAILVGKENSYTVGRPKNLVQINI